jgi:hypothetical protein
MNKEEIKLIEDIIIVQADRWNICNYGHNRLDYQIKRKIK